MTGCGLQSIPNFSLKSKLEKVEKGKAGDKWHPVIVSSVWQPNGSLFMPTGKTFSNTSDYLLMLEMQPCWLLQCCSPLTNDLRFLRLFSPYGANFASLCWTFNTWIEISYPKINLTAVFSNQPVTRLKNWLLFCLSFCVTFITLLLTTEGIHLMTKCCGPRTE